MSVVNKMLQDLEARQSQTDEVKADYQPPPKKQSKLLVLILLILAISAIIFALTDTSQMFDNSANTEGNVPTNSQFSPPAPIKKMTVISKKTQLVPQTTSTQPFKQEIELIDSETEVALTNSDLVNQEVQPKEHTITTNKSEPLQQVEPKDSTDLNNQKTTEQTSSFSMSDSSAENKTNSLKQRIAESLDNNNHDLATALLGELLVSEPNNIKARKKLASLLFAQGSYAQCKQLLIQGIELHPNQSDIRLMLARLYVVQKEPSKAMNILLGFTPNLGNQTEYLAYRAGLAQQLKQIKLAKSDYQSLTNIEPTNAKWWLGLAIAEDQLGDTNLAVQAYNKAHSLDQLDSSVSDFIQQRISALVGTQ
jgi:MSHA biogenesis protein MshN